MLLLIKFIHKLEYNTIVGNNGQDIFTLKTRVSSVKNKSLRSIYNMILFYISIYIYHFVRKICLNIY